MITGFYLLKPADLQIAHFYESKSSYKKAILYYQKVLKKETNTKTKKNVLKRLATLYRYTNQPELYIITVKKMCSSGTDDIKFIHNALDIALKLWQKNTDNIALQNDVLFFAKALNKSNFIKNFLVWNRRFKEALNLYWADYKHKKLSPQDIQKAITIASWTNKDNLKIKWLKAGLYYFPDNINYIEQLSLIYLNKNEYKKALAILYTSLNNIKNTEHIKKIIRQLIFIALQTKDIKLAKSIIKKYAFMYLDDPNFAKFILKTSLATGEPYFASSIAKICWLSLKSRLQKVNSFVRGQANSDSERCDGCNYLKSLAVRLSPLAVICEFRLFAGFVQCSTFTEHLTKVLFARRFEICHA